MVGRDDARFASTVAENAVTTCEWFRDGRRFAVAERQQIIADMERELLAAMPASSSANLAQACNRILSSIPDRGLPVPRVAGIDTDEGFIRMRPS